MLSQKVVNESLTIDFLVPFSNIVSNDVYLTIQLNVLEYCCLPEAFWSCECRVETMKSLVLCQLEPCLLLYLGLSLPRLLVSRTNSFKGGMMGESVIL